MRKTIKILATFLALILAISMLPMSVMATETTGDTVNTDPSAISTPEQFMAMAADGNYYLTNDIDFSNTTITNTYLVENFYGTLNGNGYTLTVNGEGNYYAIITYGGTIANLTINAGFRAVVTYTPTEDVVLDNVTIVGDSICYGFNTAEHTTLEGIDLVVKNSTICGWVSFDGGFESVSFENCNFVQGTYYNNVVGRLVKPYVSTTFTNCTFVTNAYLDLSALEAGATVLLTGCKVGEVDVTVDVFTTTEDDPEVPFTYEAPAGVELVIETVEGGVSFHRHGYADATCTAPATCACGATDGDALGHSYTDGICGTCGGTDPNHYFVVTIPEALAKADGAKVQLTGVVISTEAWNSQYGNMSVTIRDAEGNTIYVFRLKTQVGLGDTITLKGVVGSYNDAKQIAAGATATIDVVHGDNHTYENGVCTVCGTNQPVAGEETVVCDFSTLSTGTQYADESNSFGDYITVSTHNKGCHFNTQLRIYDSSSNNGWAIVTSTNTITSLKVNAGYKAATLNVYGSVDGETWVLIKGVSTTTSYANYTVDVDETAGYKYLKLDASGAQIRVASLEVTIVK